LAQRLVAGAIRWQRRTRPGTLLVRDRRLVGDWLRRRRSSRKRSSELGTERLAGSARREVGRQLLPQRRIAGDDRADLRHALPLELLDQRALAGCEPGIACCSIRIR